MAKTAAHKRAVCNLITGTGNTIKLHTADPGTTGTGAIATTPATANTTWATAVDGTGTYTGWAASTGSPVTFQVPANTTVSHYSIWSGATFLRGEALDASITVNANGPVNVDITPRVVFN